MSDNLRYRLFDCLFNREWCKFYIKLKKKKDSEFSHREFIHPSIAGADASPCGAMGLLLDWADLPQWTLILLRDLAPLETLQTTGCGKEKRLIINVKYEIRICTCQRNTDSISLMSHQQTAMTFFFHDTFPKLMFSGKTDTCYGVRAEYSSAFFHRNFVLKLLL